MKTLIFRYFFYILFLCFLSSCRDSPVKVKHNAQYLAVQKKVIEFRTQIDDLNLDYSRREAFEMKKILNTFAARDIDDFVRRTKLDEENLVIFLDTYDELTDRIKKSRNLFVNSYEQQIYSELRAKALSDKSIIEPYFRKIKDRVGSDEYFIKMFLKKLVEFENPKDLAAAMMMTGIEFNARIIEFNNGWEDIIELIVETEQAKN